MGRRCCWIGWLAICYYALHSSHISAHDRIAGRPHATRSEVIARQGMAATSHPLATQVAIDILRRGGSAVDAAIAANATLSVVEPMMCGPGGDLFAILWDAKSKQLYGLNASGRSPYDLTLDHFAAQQLKAIPTRGPLSVSVPGCVDGWFELHGRFGNLPMEQILQPAITYARDGFPVSEQVAFDWEVASRSFRENDASFRAVFTIEGRTPVKGEVVRNLPMAQTLEQLAHDGRDAFYRGPIAQALVSFMQSRGGFFSLRDLADHRSQWVEPVSTNYRGYDVWEIPPNGQGISVLQMLNILEAYDLRRYGFGSKEHVHYFVEAKKLAYEDRAKFYADQDFNRLPVEALISKPYAEQRRKLISDANAALRYEPGDPLLQQGETTYLTVADKDGNMISLIQSTFNGFGSGLVPETLGFALQNRGSQFSLQPDHFNVYAPHKRPFHTIIPAFITKDGQPFMSFGVMGGAMQPQGHVQIIMNIVDFDMNLQEAGDAPRINHEGSSSFTTTMTDGGTVYVESGIPYETVRELMKMGHKVGFSLNSYGGYQAIRLDPKQGVYFGASESRKDGQAAGY
jgi:gamma-glutamyltranspeptidase/glutathione hydrolase